MDAVAAAAVREGEDGIGKVDRRCPLVPAHHFSPRFELQPGFTGFFSPSAQLFFGWTRSGNRDQGGGFPALTLIRH
jgi:hypothetical protein